MKTILFFTALVAIVTGCTEKTTNITQVNGPEDWQGPELHWLTAPEAEVRGTVGLDVAVTDSSGIAVVTFFVNGLELNSVTEPPYRFQLVTDSLQDGVQLVEARARDEYGNLGISPVLRVNVSNSVAQGPRLIWVPDEFARIQDAVNAAVDYDTIRVRDGVYRETLNLFGKGLWIESEHGPTRCTVDAEGAANVIFIPPCYEIVTIRGFTLRTGYIQVFADDGARFHLYNNMLLSTTWQDTFPFDSTYTCILTGSVGGSISNNLFSGTNTTLQLFSFQGNVSNNILQHASEFALWNSDRSRNPIIHAYNLFWQNDQDYAGFTRGEGEFNADPLIDLTTGQLLPGSPCVDFGDPSLYDLDGTRSDIGPFGGPNGYR